MKCPSFTFSTDPAYHQLFTVPVFWTVMVSPDGSGFTVLEVLDVLDVLEVLDVVLLVDDVLDVVDVDVLGVGGGDGIGSTLLSKLPSNSN